MKRLLFIAMLGCLANLGRADEGKSLEFNVPVYFGADKNVFVEQLVDVDYKNLSEPETALIYGDIEAKSRLLMAFNTRHFSFYLSPGDLYLMITNNYASRENYGMVYKRMTVYPYLEAVMQTPKNGKARELWSVSEWKEDSGSVLLKNRTEGEEDSIRSFSLEHRIPDKNGKKMVSGQHIVLGEQPLFYQLIPSLDVNGLPSDKQYLLVSRTDNTWGIVFRNFPANLTIKYGKKKDSFSMIDNQSPDEELEFKRTAGYPFFEVSSVREATPVE